MSPDLNQTEDLTVNDWNPSQIRQLRSRLGWSQAEFARQMKCNLATVSGWESGLTKLESNHRSQMFRIFHQAEANCEQVQRRPIAEILMRDRGLSQIHNLEILESVSIEVSAREI